MSEKGFKRIIRAATPEERQRHAEARQKIVEEFPPADGAAVPPAPPGIPSRIRQARQAQGLTWYTLAERAGIASSNTVRDIEYGRDCSMSAIAAVAKVLGLRLELVAEPADTGSPSS